MQAWIVRHREKDGVYMTQTNYGIHIHLFPQFFKLRVQAESLAALAGKDDWQVVEVEITEK